MPADMLPAAAYFDLRGKGSSLPAGRCVYIQSGDPGDFDGYFIAAAGNLIHTETSQCEYVVVVPERRACADRSETDTSKHDPVYSEQVMATAGALFRRLCPAATIVRGPLNKKNVIPLKFIFSEPDKYGPLLQESDTKAVNWSDVNSLAAVLNQPDVGSVIIDMNGSMGYFPQLHSLVPNLGGLLKASGLPITVMAGVVSDALTATLAVPGRDTRATMNAIYHPEAVPVLLSLAQQHSISLLFVTNNACNQLLTFQDGAEVVQEFELQGLLKSMAEVWYGPHLKGKCVPFDWVSFVSMLIHGRLPGLLTTEQRHLYVGDEDPSILVLHDPSQPASDISTANLKGTTLWGEVDSVVGLDKTLMLLLARHVSKAHPA